MHLQANEEYGLRCLVQVAALQDATGHGAAPVPIAAIARAEGLSEEYTAKLMRQLRMGGLVVSVRGAGGGYRLAQPADEITVWAALRVLGGEPFPHDFCDCHPGQRSACVRDGDCSLRPLWRTLQHTIRSTLSAITLEDLRRDERAMTLWLEDGSPVSDAFRAAFHKETTPWT